jgi:hypothetical protein
MNHKAALMLLCISVNNASVIRHDMRKERVNTNDRFSVIRADALLKCSWTLLLEHPRG